MKKISYIFVLCLVFLFCVVSANAAPNQWYDKAYDFKQIKTILVLQPTFSQEVTDNLARQKFTDVATPELKKFKVNFIFLPQLLDNIKQDTGIDMIALYQKDEKQYDNVLFENVPKYADCILMISVPEMGLSERYREPYSVPWTSYNTSYINYGGYSGTVQTPQTNYINVPGRYRTYANAAISIKLLDAKNINLIWGYSDSLSKRGKDAAPVMEKLLKSAVENSPLPKFEQK